MKKLLFIMMLGLMFGQTKLETRLFDLEVDLQDYESMNFSLSELTGIEIEEAIFQIYKIEIIEMGDVARLYFYDNMIDTWGNNNNNTANELFTLYTTGATYGCGLSKTYNFYEHRNNIIDNDSYDCHLILTLAITTEFPEEDTGYIEEGYEYCLNEGFNLVSYPCDNSIPIAQAIPNGLTFLNSIIGEGVASQYLDGAGWVGNLTSLQSGDGYWFEANTSTCFQYECSE